MAKRYHRYRDDGTGNVYEKNGAFHVRWWTVENGQRRQRSKKLCDKDRDHASTRSKAVLDLAAEHMATTRTNKDAGDQGVQTIVAFYDETYLPWATKELKATALHSLQQIWRQHLKDHFGETKLGEYKTHTASKFLTTLAGKYARNTVQHIRSTMSGVFTHAINHGLIESNPIHECKVLTKMRAGTPTEHYTLEELENLVTALVKKPELQLTVCLAGFAGLRPGEIEALKWEDFNGDWLHVRRAVGRGVIDVPKTEDSVRSVPLISPVKLALEAWRRECHGVTEGWVYPGRRKEKPGVLTTRTRAIKAIVDKKKMPWKTLYAGRRGAATILTQLTGNPLAAAQLLGHRDTAVTMTAYIKHDRRVLIEGMKLLETATKS